MISTTFKKQLELENNFIKLYKFTCCLPKEQAYMLSYLIDAEDFVENRLKVDSSYFECTNEFVKKLLSGWSDTEINTAQQKLRERGLIDIIKISTAGCVKHKFIKLNIENICKLKNNSTFKITDSPIIVIKKYST